MVPRVVELTSVSSRDIARLSDDRSINSGAKRKHLLCNLDHDRDLYSHGPKLEVSGHGPVLFVTFLREHPAMTCLCPVVLSPLHPWTPSEGLGIKPSIIYLALSEPEASLIQLRWSKHHSDVSISGIVR
jgi:hypothetical protein